MSETVLVTGGAGFIGSHLVDSLVCEGYRVRVIDALVPEVHPTGAPEFLNSEAEYIFGSLDDERVVRRGLQGVDVVMHLASLVGVGQSMFQISRYVAANCVGTATLLNTLVGDRHEIRKLVVASSMSVYGEGSYLCEGCGSVRPRLRDSAEVDGGRFDPVCPTHRVPLTPAPTHEEAILHPASVYAVTKRDQEELVVAVGSAYGFETTVFRYFGIYGPRQALTNPYAGLMAIFACRLVNGNPPLIFEDGRQLRDFVYVSDAVRAHLLDLRKSSPRPVIYNLGRGEPVPVVDVARTLAHYINPSIEPHVTGRYRKGDIRQCYADVSKLREELGFAAEVDLREGLFRVAEAARSRARAGRCQDRVEQMWAELVDKQLVR